MTTELAWSWLRFQPESALSVWFLWVNTTETHKIGGTGLELALAAALYDVGKIGVPDAVLLKAGALDAQEWEAIKKHTSLGAILLSGSSSPLLEMARHIALTHHECWNGEGYPQGLQGEEVFMTAAAHYRRLTSSFPSGDRLTTYSAPSSTSSVVSGVLNAIWVGRHRWWICRIRGGSGNVLSEPRWLSVYSTLASD